MNAQTPATLDFDARVPIPISVFPSTYRSDSVDSTQVDVKEDINIQTKTTRGGREGIDSYSYSQSGPRTKTKVVERITTDTRRRPYIKEDVQVDVRDDIYEVDRTRYSAPYQRYADTQIGVEEQVYDREYRTVNLGREEVDVNARISVDETTRGHRDMGYYDEDGNYHSFRHGLHRAADRILHPIHGGRHHHRDEIREEVDVDVDVRTSSGGGGPAAVAPRYREDINVRYIDRSIPANTITIPCHHIHIGDLLILQGRPCQVIKITTSSSTGQLRYLGVDLFSKQMYEESSFSSNPSPSVYVQNMLGPVFKQYRVLDMHDDGTVTAMTETGDVKQRLRVVDQGSLFARLNESFANGRGTVRVLVINDGGRELAVDYKVIYGSRL